VDFTEDPDHRLIRAAIREICARFPDQYWAGVDESHTFPWEFYDAMAKGGWMRIAPVPQEMVLNYLAEHVLGLPRSY
jgi:acyl-CoA dehydrogenase